MTYDIEKGQFGKEYVQEIEIQLDACKYAYGAYAVHNRLSTDNVSLINAGDVDATININASDSSAAWYLTWNPVADLYAMTQYGEIVSFDITSGSQIQLSGRGLFGTIATNIPRYSILRIMHKGEADGSCRGFAYGCSTPNAYDPDYKVPLIFSTGQSSGGALRFSGLRRISHEAGEVDPGESIGTRARLRFEISDQVHDDIGIVPYPDKRTSNGTMFGKLLARNPYFQGRPVIYREGFRNSNSYYTPDFVSRKFIIDDANLSGGMFSVTALDPLIYLEDKKAKIPVASPATLAGNITNATTSFSFLDAPNNYFGGMSSTVFVRIDSEVIKCTVSGTTTLTIVDRGYRSVEKNHDAGASIQDCVVFTETNGIDAIVYALEEYTSIPASFIDDYSATIALLPAFELSEAIISKPMAVGEFVDSLVKLGNLIFYYNEITQKIVIDYIPELSIEPILIDGQVDIKRDSVRIDYNSKNQFTRFAYLWNPVDITNDNEENYAIRFLSVNIALEQPENIGQVNEKKTIKNPLLTGSTGDSLLATTYVNRVLSTNEEPPIIANVTLDASRIGNTEGGVLALGSIINLITQYNQDKDGNRLADLYQVQKISGDGFRGYQTKLKRYQAVQPGDVAFTVTASAVNYDLSTEFAPDPGEYTVYIDSNVVLGSNDVTLPAFTTGAQESGVILKIINRGRILGMGGVGGDAGIWSSGTETMPTAGQGGGIALNITVPTTIDNGAGLIWAGGAGQSGQRQTRTDIGGNPLAPQYYYPAAAGGIGGQGYGTAIGGLSTYAGYPPSAPTRGPRAQSGNQSSGNPWGQSSGAILGGIAIQSNGNTVTVTSGDNDSSIRGRRT